MYQIPVNTGRPYSVLVRRGILQNTWQEIENIKSYQAVCIVTDDKVAPLYLDTVMGTIPSSVRVEHYAIPHGESSKNGENFFRLQEFPSQVWTVGICYAYILLPDTALQTA